MVTKKQEKYQNVSASHGAAQKRHRHDDGEVWQWTHFHPPSRISHTLVSCTMPVPLALTLTLPPPLPLAPLLALLLALPSSPCARPGPLCGRSHEVTAAPPFNIRTVDLGRGTPPGEGVPEEGDVLLVPLFLLLPVVVVVAVVEVSVEIAVRSSPIISVMSDVHICGYAKNERRKRAGKGEKSKYVELQYRSLYSADCPQYCL